MFNVDPLHYISPTAAFRRDISLVVLRRRRWETLGESVDTKLWVAIESLSWTSYEELSETPSCIGTQRQVRLPLWIVLLPIDRTIASGRVKKSCNTA